MYRVVLLIVFLLYVSPGASAQACSQVSDPAIQTALAHLPECRPYVPTTTFVPATGYVVQLLDALHAVVRLMGSKTNSKKYLPRACVDSAVQYFCSFIFRPCSPEGLPRPPCSSVCTSFPSVCRFGVSIITATINASALEPIVLPACDSLENGNLLLGSSPMIAGQPVFPNSVQTWNVSNNLLNVTCSAPELISPLNFTCNGDSWVSGPADQPYCVVSCPGPFHTEGTKKFNTKMLFIIGIISIIVGAIAFTMRFVITEYRRYPANLVLFLMACFWLDILNWIWPFFYHRGSLYEKNTKFICDGGYMSARPDIQIQGFILIVTDLAGVFYWGAIAVHTLVALLLAMEQFPPAFQIVTHCVCAGAPLIFAIIALASGNLMGNPFTPFAYFKTGTRDDPFPRVIWAEFTCYFAPLGLVLLVVIVCCGAILFMSFRHQLHSHVFKWTRNFRIMLFLLVMVFIEAWKWSYRMALQADQKTYFDSTVAYVQCQLFQQNCPRGPQLNQGLVRFFFLCFFVRSLLTSILFGCNVDVLRHWYYAILSRRNPFSTILKTSTTASDSNSHANTTQTVATAVSLTDA